MSSHPTRLLTVNEDEETYLIRCHCYTHMLILTVYKDDLLAAEGDGLVHLSIETLGRSERSWSSRWKDIWRLLRGQELFLEEVILSPEIAEEVGETLVLLSRRMRSPERTMEGFMP